MKIPSVTMEKACMYNYSGDVVMPSRNALVFGGRFANYSSTAEDAAAAARWRVRPESIVCLEKQQVLNMGRMALAGRADTILRGRSRVPAKEAVTCQQTLLPL